jgi:hypothetical protein
MEGGIVSYRSTISNLERLEDVEEQFGSLLAEQNALTNGVGVVDLPSAIDGAGGSSDIGQNTGHTNVVGLSGNLL